MATLGDEFLNQAALRTEVRLQLGMPNQAALLPDAQIDSILRDSLRQLNLKDPLIGVGTFVTVAGQQRYQPLPTDAYVIRDAWWPAVNTSCQNVFSNLIIDLNQILTGAGPVSGDVAGLMITIEPAAVQIVQRRQAWLRRQLGGKARIFDDETIYLIPEPVESGTNVVFTFSQPRYDTVFLVQDRRGDAFWAATRWKGYGRLASGANAVMEVRDPEAGVVIKINTDSFAKAARTARSEFMQNFTFPTRGFPST